MTYDRDHPLHGRSTYDGIVVRLRRVDDDTYLYLEKVDAAEFEVESLSEAQVNVEDEIKRRI